MKTNISSLLKQFHENYSFKTPSCRTLGDSSDMQNDDLMHREGLTLSSPNLALSSSSTTQFSTCSG